MNSTSYPMKIKLSFAMLLISSVVMGQASQTVVVQKGPGIDTNTILIIFAVFLLFPIWTLSNAFIAAAKYYFTEKSKSGMLKVLIPFVIILLSHSVFAQTNTPTSSFGLSANGMSVLLLCVIGAEMLLILFFAQKTNEFIRKIKYKNAEDETVPGFWEKLKAKWTEMNFKPIEEEFKIDTGHSYDGIRELDNVIPPWFTTAFLITIVIAIGYFYRYQIAKSGPTQIQEYETSVALAEVQQEEYLKKQANSVDETTVKRLTGADLEAGQKTFKTICATCHKSDGGGMVGPNLCDSYWIHGGSLKEVFKTIKYGYPEKGMISWKDQLSPVQIAQVANYVLTLRGTNPPDAKEKQGTLYVQDAITTDTSAVPVVKPDSLTIK